VRATGIIGSRIHPLTGVLIVYVTAVLVGEVAAPGSGELTMVRWVSFVEAEEFMADMFGLVRGTPAAEAGNAPKLARSQLPDGLGGGAHQLSAGRRKLLL